MDMHNVLIYKLYMHVILCVYKYAIQKYASMTIFHQLNLIAS